jgi:alpha-galactosidase
MPKIAFMGAGSTVFAKNIIGDCMLTDSLRSADVALYDVDAGRLDDSVRMLDHLNRNINEGRASIKGYLGVEQRKDALRGADYVVNAIQVGGYEPCTVTDFEVPKRYRLRQTIADTLGVGGIFRALRTAPVMLDFARDMEAVCPEAWMLNYTNPMAMVTGAVQRGSEAKCVGLCHSVQVCPRNLLNSTGLGRKYEGQELQARIGGINHMAWLLELKDADGVDLYPEAKKQAAELLARIRAAGGGRALRKRLEQEYGEAWDALAADHPEYWAATDMTRLQLMLDFGYYITESSEHFAEYTPWYIKDRYPELVDMFTVPLDEYPRRCIGQIEGWRRTRETLVSNGDLAHARTHEYGSYIMDALETGRPFAFGGSVLNDGLIGNLPARACVEVPCVADGQGVHAAPFGELPEQCAALNLTNINVQILAVEAVLTGRKDYVYQAAMLDPHTAGELSRDDIRTLCDDLFEAHKGWLPEMK